MLPLNAAPSLLAGRASRYLCVLAAIALHTLAFQPLALANPIPAIDFSSPTENYQNEYPWTLGFDFRVYEDLIVSSLGFYDAGADGFAEDHSVGLWDESGVLLAQAIITNDSLLEGLFRWETITPVTLMADNLYVIAGFTTLDEYTWNPYDYSQDGRFYLRGGRYEYSDALEFPEQSMPELIGLFGPNFMIADASEGEPPFEVPLPSSLPLLAAGLILLVVSLRRKRSNSHALFPTLLTFVFLMGMSNLAHALSATAQAVQGPASWEGQVPLGTRYLRYTHENIGAIVEYDRVHDSEGNYIVPVGDKFRWVWVRDGIQLGAFEWTYIGGTGKCWVTSSGTQYCGEYGRFLAFNKFRCRPESGSYTQIVFWNGNEINRHDFETERFKILSTPSMWVYPTSLRPKRYAGIAGTDGDGEQKSLSFKVTDDLGCRQNLKDVRVTVQSFVVPASNHHAHFSAGDKGTGKFKEAPGFEAITSAENTKVEGKTNESGLFKVDYRAMDFAVDETAKIAFVRPAERGYPEDKREASVRWTIKMDEYMQADVYPHTWLFGSEPGVSCLAAHTEQAMYLRADVWPKLMSGLNNFHYRTEELVRLNDASFPQGGAVDTVASECKNHKSHRQGIDIDINNRLSSGKRILTDRWAVPFDLPPGFPPFPGIPLIDVLSRRMNDEGFVRITEEPIHYRYEW